MTDATDASISQRVDQHQGFAESLGQSNEPSRIYLNPQRLPDPSRPVNRKMLDTHRAQTKTSMEELKKPLMSMGEIAKRALITAVAIGGIVGTASSVLATAPLSCCIVVGALVGVFGGTVTAVTLYKNNYNQQERIGGSKSKGLRIANEGSIDAYGAQGAITGTVLSQRIIVEEHKKDIERQRRLVKEQTMQIEAIAKKNAEFERNLEAVKEAKAAADRQVAKIQSSAAELESILANIQEEIEKKKAKIAELEGTNSTQAEALQEETEVTQSFVDQQKETVSQLKKTVEENQACSNSMFEKVQTGSPGLQKGIGALKIYVQNPFGNVQKDLKVATTKSQELLKGFGGGSTKAMTIEKLVETQGAVNQAMLGSIIRLGIMQTHIIGGLTNVEKETKKQQEEIKKTIGFLHQSHGAAIENIEQLESSRANMVFQLGQCQEQVNKAVTEANKLNVQGKGSEIDKLAQLQGELAAINTELIKARTDAESIATIYGELEDKQTRIQANCVTLAQQNQTLRKSNDELFGHTKIIGGNLGITGKSIGQASAAVADGAVDGTDNVTSRWSMLRTGVVGAGAAAVAGNMLLPFLFPWVWEGVNSQYIKDIKAKAQKLEDNVKSILSTSKQRIEKVASAVVMTVSNEKSFLDQMTRRKT
jgi:hypothetical protein